MLKSTSNISHGTGSFQRSPICPSKVAVKVQGAFMDLPGQMLNPLKDQRNNRLWKVCQSSLTFSTASLSFLSMIITHGKEVG